jgi:hypothetical protein
MMTLSDPYACETPTTPSLLPPLIQPTSVIDLGRPTINWRYVLAGCGLAVVLHAYALAILPAAMEVDFEVWNNIDFIDDNTRDANLENDEIGIDPDLPTNYNIDRIEDLSGAGPVRPDEQVDIWNAPDGPPGTLRPPPRIIYTK